MTKVAAGRPLRADARRNRERVLVAAREVFAEQGHEAQMDDVARRAMVGVGTVYRPFPTKDKLIDAIAAEAFLRLVDVATRQLERDDDPWDALVTTLWAGAEILAGDRVVSEILAETNGPVTVDLDAQRLMSEAMDALIRRAQAAGALRADVVLDDIPMLMCGIGTAANCKPHVIPDAWRRHLAIVIDGLRAPSASGPLPTS
jgi:AcrR family transcriptional regulator